MAACSTTLTSITSISTTGAVSRSSCPSSVGLVCSNQGNVAMLAKPSMSLHAAVRGATGKSKARVVCAVGDVSEAGNTYLIAGAVAVALVGTAFPILFARKDLCPQCDGAGFVRAADSTLRANAATKVPQIVCPTCKGLGKLNQTDK